MRYSECDANILYQNWCDFLGAPHSLSLRLRLAESWSGRNNEGVYATAQEIMFAWFGRVIKAKARGDMPAFLMPDEQQLLERLMPKLRLESLLQLWENLQQQAMEAEHSNLDHKTVWLNIFDKAAHTLAV
jgi:hypothetical protein